MAIKTEKDLSNDARALWLKAITAVERHNYAYSVSLIQTVLKETPEFLDGRKILRKAEIAATKGKKSMFGGFSTQALKGPQLLKKDPVAALDLAEKILEHEPRSSQGNHLLKEASVALGYYETAIFAMQTMVDAEPKDTKLLHELADLYFSNGDSEKASNIYTKIQEINPADLIAAKRAKDAAAATTMKAGGWDTAGDYRDLIKNKDEAKALEQKNRVVKSDEVIAEQIDELRQQIEEQPENIDVARRIAGLYEAGNDSENAIAWYEYANQLAKGSDNWLLRKIGDLHLKTLENGIREREEWLALAGDDHEESPRVRLEVEELKHQRTEMLLDETRKRVERNPTDLVFKYELGEQMALAGHYTEAIPELQKARQNPNVRIKAMNILGQCYVGKGMNDLAVKVFLEASAELANMDATKKEIIYRLGLLYERMEQKDKALDCFKQIYEVDYGYEDVAARVESSYGE